MKSKRLLTALATVSALLLLSAPSLAGGASFAKSIEKAHGAKAWYQKAAFETEITVEFGGQQALAGTLLTDPVVGKVRIDLGDGTALVLNEEGVWKAPADSAFPGARFHILTWPYFVAAPMKLRDPGAQLEKLGKLPLKGGEELPAARLTFESGVGDTPDDWYVVYRDAESNRLAGMAYIVTFGKDTAAAEAEPHAITYHDFVEVEGVSIPTRWKFWNWSREKGIEGDPIGNVQLKKPRFVTPAADAFATPAGAEAQPLPGS